MGRKRKFGEKSAWVSVRVPKSKVKEYRMAVREFVEKKFAVELKIKEKTESIYVLVPKNRVLEFKREIYRFVEKKFLQDSFFKEEEELTNVIDDSTGLQTIEEFVNDVLKGKEEEKDD